MHKPVIVSIFASLIALATIGCDGGDSPAASDNATVDAPAEAASVTLEIEGMDCVSCAMTIEEGFDEADEIVDGSVDFGARTATVNYDAERFDESDVVGVVEESGFDAAVVDEP